MAAPLDLHITPRRPRFLAGESAVIDIAHRVHTALDMETVELNDDRTRITVSSLADPAAVMELSGVSHRVTRGSSPLVPLGRRFHAPAGSAWDSYLDLSLFHEPLSAGRYRVEIAYRYGDTPAEVVRSNAVEFEVAPAVTRSVSDRWFADSQPRGTLASLWVVGDGEEARWIYRVAISRDPRIVDASTDISPALAEPAPVLAHLNNIAAFHFERFAAWIDGGELRWVTLGDRMLLAPPQGIAHGLRDPRLVDPPLHRRDGSLVAVVLGSDARTFVAEVPQQGPAHGQAHPFSGPLPDHAVVVWSADESHPSGTLYAAAQGAVSCGSLDGASRREILHTSDRVIALLADQWMGLGQVHVLLRGEGVFRVESFRIEDAAPTDQHSLEIAFAAIQAGAEPPDPIGVASSPSGLSLLFRGDEEWIVMTPEGRKSVRFSDAPAPSTPRLVATRRSAVFLVFPHAAHGFLARQVTATPEDEHDHEH